MRKSWETFGRLTTFNLGMLGTLSTLRHASVSTRGTRHLGEHGSKCLLRERRGYVSNRGSGIECHQNGDHAGLCGLHYTSLPPRFELGSGEYRLPSLKLSCRLERQDSCCPKVKFACLHRGEYFSFEASFDCKRSQNVVYDGRS